MKSSPAQHSSDERSPIVVRSLSNQAEFEEAVELQEEIWGADTRETVPACVLQIAREVGGISLGAFSADGRLAGLVFGLTGIRDGHPAHWSHILAVSKAWRDRGVGRTLKQHQRSKLLAMDVDRMYWTFDPLESRNAHLNLNILGARVEAYLPHFYGETAVATTDTVIGTDRLIVCWNLREQRTIPSQHPVSLAEIPSVMLRADSGTNSLEPIPAPGIADMVRIEAPSDIQSLKHADPEAAREWRRATRSAFMGYLGAGYAVTEFRTGSEGRGGWYVLASQP